MSRTLVSVTIVLLPSASAWIAERVGSIWIVRPSFVFVGVMTRFLRPQPAHHSLRGRCRKAHRSPRPRRDDEDDANRHADRAAVLDRGLDRESGWRRVVGVDD